MIRLRAAFITSWIFFTKLGKEVLLMFSPYNLYKLLVGCAFGFYFLATRATLLSFFRVLFLISSHVTLIPASSGARKEKRGCCESQLTISAEIFFYCSSGSESRSVRYRLIFHFLFLFFFSFLFDYIIQQLIVDENQSVTV